MEAKCIDMTLEEIEVELKSCPDLMRKSVLCAARVNALFVSNAANGVVTKALKQLTAAVKAATAELEAV